MPTVKPEKHILTNFLPPRTTFFSARHRPLKPPDDERMQLRRQTSPASTATIAIIKQTGETI
jgi:hypothetical protein